MARYSKNLRPCLERLKPYVAGKGIGEIASKYGLPPGEIVKLGSNENPRGPSPRVFEAIGSVRPERYPEPEGLIEALADYAGSASENVLIGAGMDGVMDTITRLFLDPGDRTAIYTPTFSYYEILTVTGGAEPIFIPRGENFEVPTEVPAGVKIIFICSPNNPTGDLISEEDLRTIVETTDGIVFLDEAYAEFSDQNFLPMVGEYENLVVGRTTSKAFGLAGMRLGYAVAPDWIAREYRRAAPPFFGVTTPSVAAGIAALGDLEYMRRSVAAIRQERDRLRKAIPEFRPSGGNFLYLETEEPSGRVAEEMLRRGVIVRDCFSFRGAGDHAVRVTVGTPGENDRFLEAYGEVCGSP
ncbi:histidinol-phosphate transaminase [Methanocrinis sp.]|uniref:histidinol-phosphate transaminase n=1 Tax=Methanocrinis sp. TaxID=3101522 RepID=UPI003D0A2A36